MKRSILLIAALAAALSMSCSFFGSDDGDGDSGAQQQKVVTPQILAFNLAGAAAIGGTDGSPGTRAISDSTVLKILTDGTAESLITIPEGYERNMAQVKAIYQSHVSSGKEIYIIFANSSFLWKEGKSIKISPLICVKEDGTYVDILNPTGAGDGDDYWISTWDNQDCMWFDQNGYAFFLVNESGSGQSSQMIYRFDPKTNNLLQLVPAVTGTNYQKVMVSRDGNWIFAHGARYNNSSNTTFLRAIPVSNPENPINLIYSTGSGWINSWHYDDKTGKVLVYGNMEDDNSYLYEFTKQRGNTYSTAAKKTILSTSSVNFDTSTVFEYSSSWDSSWSPVNRWGYYDESGDYRIIDGKTEQEILKKITSAARYVGDVDFRLDVIAREPGYRALNTTLKNLDAIAWLRANPEKVKLLVKYCFDVLSTDNELNDFIAKVCFIKGTDKSAMVLHSLVGSSGFIQGVDNFMGNGFGSVWGYFSLRSWENNSQKKAFVKITDTNGNYVFDIPASLENFKPVSYVYTNDSFYFTNSILIGTSESGYQDIYRCTSDGQFTNMFQNVPNSNTLEITSFSTNGDMLYYSGVRGTQTVSGRINTRTLSHETLNISKKLTSIIVLK